MNTKVESKLRNSQFGFRSGKGTVDAIFVMRQIIEKAKEKKFPLHLHFIDFKAAFDTAWRTALWKMLKAVGIKLKIINILKYMYDNTQCSVAIDGKLSQWFEVLIGVRQGCILSPTLFNIFLEFVMDELTSLTNFHLEEQMSTEIRYADDTTLISLIFEKLKLSSEELENACKKWGLKINSTKCKVITTEVNDHITINDQIVENVENFNFLGSTIPIEVMTY